MKKYKFLLLSVVIIFLGASGCKTPETISGYYTYELECLGNELDGGQIVKTWGTGRDRKEAEANARKKVLHEIIFKGVRNGTADCLARPLVSAPNAEENNELYFRRFFSEEGIYTRFVSLHREPFFDKNFKTNPRSNNKVAYAMVLKVDMASLKNHLIHDQIIR